MLLPLVVWFVLYMALVRWTVLRAGPASKASSDARSAVTGRVVDAYTNIHSVKLFARHDTEMAYAKESIEHARETFKQEMRIITKMDLALTVLNGFLIVAVTGWALLLWYQGQASVGTVAAATTLVLRLNNMTYWIMWATTSLVQALGVVQEGMETITQPIGLVDAPGAQLPGPLRGRAGGVRRSDQRTLRTLHLDAFGAAVAATLGQLVAQVVDGVGVRVLVALGAFGDDAHPRVLVTHAAFGDVVAGLAVVGQLVGTQELVAAVERDVALEDRLLRFGRSQRVAFDVGGLLDANAGQAGGRRGVREGGNDVFDGAQTPVLLIVGGMGRQGHRNTQR